MYKEIFYFKFAINLLIKSILFKFNFLQIFNILLYAKVKNYSILKYQTNYFYGQNKLHLSYKKSFI